MIFINPKTNFGFKKIFGSPQSKDILLSFLNGLLYEGRPTITDLEILDPYQLPRVLGGKDTYLDVKAQLNDGSLVIIEMQVLHLAGFEKRVLYNAAKGYVLQLDIGHSYTRLLPVIAVTVADFILFPTIERPLTRFIFKERDALLDYPMNDLELVFVELPKFRKAPGEAETLAEQWMVFLQQARELREVPEPMTRVAALRHAFELANQAVMSAEELEILEKQEAFILDTRITVAESREEGRQEQALATAKRMLATLDDATISEFTGLDVERVRSLRSAEGDASTQERRNEEREP